MGVAIAVTTAATNLALSFILLIVELRNRRESEGCPITSKRMTEHPRSPGTSVNLLLRSTFLEVLVFIGAVIIDHDGYG